MGTNYYLSPDPPCPCCGRSDPTRHIGKSSAGWVFALHVYPEEGIKTLKDWKPLLASGTVRDEYGRVVTLLEMFSIILDRSSGPKGPRPSGYSSWDHFLFNNGAEWGPNNLLRSRVDDRCVGQGEGTYDLFEGDFS